MTKIIMVGEAWGDSEERLRRPLVGPSGVTLAEILDQAGIISLTSKDKSHIKEYWRSGRDTASRNPYSLALLWDAHPEVYLTNVFNLRPKPANDVKNLCGDKANAIPGLRPLQAGKYVRLEYGLEIDRLKGEIASRSPNLVVALGATPAWALLGTTGISKIRGSTALSHWGVKVLPTYHPAAVMRDWSLRPIVLADMNKAKREAEFPEVRRPRREVWIEPFIGDLHFFAAKYIFPSDELSVDIETIGNIITCVGFAPSTAHALVVPFFDQTKPGHNYWTTVEEEKAAWQFVREMCALPRARFTGQNFAYDMNFLWRANCIPCPAQTDDTMLLHHALQPEMEKGLAFLGSIYTDESSWKLMRKKDTVKRED